MHSEVSWPETSLGEKCRTHLILIADVGCRMKLSELIDCDGMRVTSIIFTKITSVEAKYI